MNCAHLEERVMIRSLNDFVLCYIGKSDARDKLAITNE